jgi:flotillin
MEFLLLTIALGGLATGSANFIIKNLYYICQPSEVLIFAGTETKNRDGRKRGYRLVKGGSGIQIPLLEKTVRMDLTNMIIELRVSNAYSKGGIPLTVEGVANIKISGEEPTLHNAIERLLGKSRKDIEQLAKETLEGNLRGVLASLTPEQVNEDKIAFAKFLVDEAENDLEKLGLELDTLQIQNIADDVHYLDSIGRKQQADLQRDARIAEAQTRAESTIQASENERVTALRQIERDLQIANADADRRVRDALTKRTALVAEVESVIQSQIARVNAEVAVQTERIKQVEQQLQADIVAPAEATCAKAIAQAKGSAASIVEDGKAQVEGIRSLAIAWESGGENAREIFLLQKLEPLLKLIAAGVPTVSVQTLTVIDAENGNTATKLAAMLQQIKATTGIDAPKLLSQWHED